MKNPDRITKAPIIKNGIPVEYKLNPTLQRVYRVANMLDRSYYLESTYSLRDVGNVVVGPVGFEPTTTKV